MNKILAAIVMFALMFGTAAISRADDRDDIRHHGRYDSNYRNYGFAPGYGQFEQWRGIQRGRIEDALRDRYISRGEYDKLIQELAEVDSFHVQALHKGQISRRDDERLRDMEARVTRDIDREVGEHIRY